MRYFIVGILSWFIFINAQAAQLTLTSEGIATNALFPVLYTCDGKNISPPLQWENIPKKTVSLALVVLDLSPTIPLYHWVFYNIPPSVSSLETGVPILPKGAIQSKNSWGRAGYTGFCPPKGAMHQYSFTLYALDKRLTLSEDTTPADVLNAIDKAIIQQAEIKISYSRWPWPQ